MLKPLLMLRGNTHTTSIEVSAYCHIVDKLIFLCHNCANISYVVGIMSFYMHSTYDAHWSVLQHILLYVSYTQDLGILFDPSSDSSLHGFTNPD